VLLKCGTLLLHCISNGRVVEVIDLNFALSDSVSERVLGPLDQCSTLNYSYQHTSARLTRQGEGLVAMGARICFAWDATSGRINPAIRLSHQLHAELMRVYTGNHKMLPRYLARYRTTMALTLRDDRFGALMVVSSSEEMIRRLLHNVYIERWRGAEAQSDGEMSIFKTTIISPVW